MLVTNFRSTVTKTEITLFADFIFARPYEGRNDERFFQLKSLFKKLSRPKDFIREGICVKHTVWFKVPNSMLDKASIHDAFFTVALPLALELGEKLQFAGQVSQEILAKNQAMKSYFALPQSKSKVIALPATQDSRIKAERNHSLAQFFTLGVDSFYTLLCHKPDTNRSLVYVDGYDIPLNKKNFVEFVHRKINTVAKETNHPTIFIQTNLREVADKIISWGRYHVAALAAVGMLLQFKQVLISGETFEAADWGLRFGADRLFSLPWIKFKFIAHNITRDRKIKVLKESPYFSLFLQYVRSCWKNVEKKIVPYNCSECQKCLRTQLTFLALDIPKPPTFKTPIKPAKIAAIEIVEHVQNEWQIVYSLLRKTPMVDPEIIVAVKIVLAKPLKA